MLCMSCVCHVFASVHCCLVVTCWERADHLALVFGCLIVLLLVGCFVALRPKSTAMVIAGRSVDLTTLFPGQA